jgi:hypothetical protein
MISKTRKARSLSPSIAYPTKFEVEASLRDAKFQIAKRGVSKNKRAKFERIVEKREKNPTVSVSRPYRRIRPSTTPGVMKIWFIFGVLV